MNNQDTLRVLHIVEGTSVDGPGLRTSIYFAGCRHHCAECHNPDSWNLNGGESRTLDELMSVIAYNEAPVTLTGGDPLAQPVAMAKLARRIKDETAYDLWLYTGFTWEQILADPLLLNVVRQVDVVVDGLFIAAQRDISLRFRGSHNQRVIDVKASLNQGKPVLWQD